MTMRLLPWWFCEYVTVRVRFVCKYTALAQYLSTVCQRLRGHGEQSLFTSKLSNANDIENLKLFKSNLVLVSLSTLSQEVFFKAAQDTSMSARSRLPLRANCKILTSEA